MFLNFRIFFRYLKVNIVNLTGIFLAFQFSNFQVENYVPRILGKILRCGNISGINNTVLFKR